MARSICEMNLASLEALSSQYDYLDVDRPTEKEFDKLWRQELKTAADQARPKLRPGDLLFFRNDGPVSQLISSLNGYWSHTGVYVGKNTVVHAAMRGVVEEPFDSMVVRFKGDVARARRSGLTKKDRDRIVKEAFARVSRASDDDPDGDELAHAEFDSVSLGLAAAVAVRANLRVNYEKLSEAQKKDLARKIRDGERRFLRRWELLPESESSWTCAGLAHVAYREAKVPITPVFPDRTYHFEGMVFGTEPDEAEAFAEVLPVVVAANSVLLGFKSAVSGVKALAKLTKIMQDFGPYMYSSVPQLRHGFTSRVVLPEAAAVGPGDLWVSDDLTDRAFITKYAQRWATVASAECKAAS